MNEKINLNTISFFSASILLAATVVFNACSGPSQEQVKLTQYINRGEQLYFKHCGNCHQKDGQGLGLVYPPLAKSDFLKDTNAVICAIKNGLRGPLLVNGKEYNQAMPGIQELTNIEIAEIATYIYNSWSMNEGIVEIKQVSAALDKCSSN